jgi:hypothetical protein
MQEAPPPPTTLATTTSALCFETSSSSIRVQTLLSPEETRTVLQRVLVGYPSSMD